MDNAGSEKVTLNSDRKTVPAALATPAIVPSFVHGTTVKPGRLKTREWKTRHEVARVENAGVENTGVENAGVENVAPECVLSCLCASRVK